MEKNESWVCGFAVASLVIGILSYLQLLAVEKAAAAVVFGLIALSRIKRNPTRKGRGMAISGILLGIGYIILVAVLLIFKPSFLAPFFHR
ncbi:MAG: DUF4190 domain-containing protein [Candidatus Omnitrophica bacterium]|nr:DUF4190 domain-containing protein [Candidatus Omnitrophota bacterium]